MKKYYAGIGSRNTPSDICNLMSKIAVALENMGYILRSGGAEGADAAFADSVSNREIFRAQDATLAALSMAEEYHPAWFRCKPYVRKLHGRNCQILLGRNLDAPVDFVVCWTPDGKDTGGTGQGIRIAWGNNIAVYNLHNIEEREAILKFCNLS